MWTEHILSNLSKQDLEKWLEKVLVPIEPNSMYVRRLGARLVRFYGGKISVWILLGIMAVTLILVLMWLGIVVRFILTLLGLVKIANRRKEISAHSNPLIPSVG